MIFWTFNVVILVLVLTSSPHGTKLVNADVHVNPENFDHQAYLETHPDLLTKLHETKDIHNVTAVIEHYVANDGARGIPYPLLTPYGFNPAIAKLNRFLLTKQGWDLSGKGLNKQKAVSNALDRTLVIYHIGRHDSTVSNDAQVNNVLLFAHAISLDADTSVPRDSTEGKDETISGTSYASAKRQYEEIKHSKNFYWINAIDYRNNRLVEPFFDLFEDLSNVAIVSWPMASSDVYIHFQTLRLLERVIYGGVEHDYEVEQDEERIKRDPSSQSWRFRDQDGLASSLLDYRYGFGSILCFSHGVRGPVFAEEEGKWVEVYRNYLYTPVNDGKGPVGLVGSTLSCEAAAHIQTHAFMLHRNVIDLLIVEFASQLRIAYITNYLTVIQRYEMGLTEQVVYGKGYKILGINLAYYTTGLGVEGKRQVAYFDNLCIKWSISTGEAVVVDGASAIHGTSTAVSHNDMMREQAKEYELTLQARREEREREEKEQEENEKRQRQSNTSTVSENKRSRPKLKQLSIKQLSQIPKLPESARWINYHTPQESPLSWCDEEIQLNRIPLHKWGGGLFRMRGFLCDQMKVAMQERMLQLQRKYTRTDNKTENRYNYMERLRVPETFGRESSILRDFSLYYYQEIYADQLHGKTSKDRERIRRPGFLHSGDQEYYENMIGLRDTDKGIETELVCFFIHTRDEDIYSSYLENTDHKETIPSLLEREVFLGVRPLIESLRRQSNLNFAAVFYTLNQTLSSYLKDYLDSAFNDHFLHFFHIPDHFANDHTMPLEDKHLHLTEMLADGLQRCQWLSWIQSNTILGSEVVNEVVRTFTSSNPSYPNAQSPATGSYTTPTVDIVLPPLDSSRLIHAAHDKTMSEYLSRSLSPSLNRTNTETDNKKRKVTSRKPHEQYCIRTLNRLYQWTHGRTIYPPLSPPRPEPNNHPNWSYEHHFPLRNAFMRKYVYLSERQQYETMYNGERDRQQTRFDLRYLVRDRFLQYKKLPVVMGSNEVNTPYTKSTDTYATTTTGLGGAYATMMFELPSLLWCHSSENVYFDHPIPSKRRCLSRKSTDDINFLDHPPVEDLPPLIRSTIQSQKLNITAATALLGIREDLGEELVKVDSDRGGSRYMKVVYDNKKWIKGKRNFDDLIFDWKHFVLNDNCCLRLSEFGWNIFEKYERIIRMNNNSDSIMNVENMNELIESEYMLLFTFQNVTTV